MNYDAWLGLAVNLYCIIIGVIFGRFLADVASYMKGYNKASEDIKNIYIKSIEELSNDRNMWLQIYIDIKKRYDILVETFKDKDKEKDNV
jgi:hypothetical protein